MAFPTRIINPCYPQPRPSHSLATKIPVSNAPEIWGFSMLCSKSNEPHLVAKAKLLVFTICPTLIKPPRQEVIGRNCRMEAASWAQTSPIPLQWTSTRFSSFSSINRFLIYCLILVTLQSPEMVVFDNLIHFDHHFVISEFAMLLTLAVCIKYILNVICLSNLLKNVIENILKHF